MECVVTSWPAFAAIGGEGTGAMSNEHRPRFQLQEVVWVLENEVEGAELEVGPCTVYSCSQDYSGTYSYDVCDLRTGVCVHVGEGELKPTGDSVTGRQWQATPDAAHTTDTLTG